MIRSSALLALAWASLAAARGQDAPAAAPGTTSGGCEFHAWPGEGLTSIFYGLLHGGIVNGGQQGRRGYPRVPPGAMATAIQAELLAEAQPQRAMNHPDHRLIVHPEALDSRTIRTSRGRIAESASPCYVELIVDDVVLQQDFVNGAKLRVLFRYREFGPDAQPRNSFTTWADTSLDSFPPRTEADIPEALREMRGAFRRDITEFAGSLRGPRRLGN
jgi:hypothetical protein